MHAIPRLPVLLVCVLLAACGNDKETAPHASQDAAAAGALPNPADVLDALPPESRPYGLDVYTAHCASCHGDLGQGVAGNPPLRGMSRAVMQQKLLDYQAGKMQGDKAAQMVQAVARLSAAEIAAASRYAGE